MTDSLSIDFKNKHVHFVGIKGTGMVALVELLHAKGAVITGSDVSERFYTDEILEKLNIKALPFSRENITEDVDYVIYSSAYSSEKNPDLIEAKSKNIPMYLYSEALGLVSQTAFSAGICGVHGKTTTTGFAGTILKYVDLNSQALAGSIISSFDNSCTMTSRSFNPDNKHYFVAETCEYQRHFLSFSPRKILLTSVESDHQDYYPTYESIRDAFVEYIMKLPEGGDLIYCADNSGAVETANIARQKRSDINFIPYGVNAEGDYKLTFGQIKNGRHQFKIDLLGDCEISVPGDHNLLNACGAAALISRFLIEDGKRIEDYKDRIKEGLVKFSGGKRRSEVIARTKTPNGQELILIDDYGHHPTAINTTLKGFRDFYSGHKIIVDFMSHTYSRTQALLEEFASSFKYADTVIINKIYGSAREDASKATVTGEVLAEHARKYHSNVIYAQEFEQAADVVYKLLQEDSGKEYPDGYLFVTMGAGDNWKVGSKLLEKLAD